MPNKLDKDIKYDIVVKSLRRREVSCLVPAVTPPNPSHDSTSASKTEEVLLENKPAEEIPSSVEPLKNTHGKRCSRKNKLQSPKVKESPKPIDSEDTALVTPIATKRAYRRRTLQSPKVKESPKSICAEDTALVTPIATKRPYQRRTINVSFIAKRWSKTAPDLEDDNAVFTPTAVKKRAYKRKSSVGEPLQQADHSGDVAGTPVKTARTSGNEPPLVPQNTPITINCQPSGECNTSPLVVKRGRGRPLGRKSQPPPVFSTDEESTCSMMSQGSRGSAASRRSKKLWFQGLELEDQADEPLSEYELQRQRNVEENMKMLRQIFMDQGLDFEEKSSSSNTPKVKKSYTRLPLPPPRPKSTRIEDRRSTQPLDFNNLSDCLSLLD